MPGTGGAYAGDGKGGFASNHLHWAVVNLEPHLLGRQVQLQAHDLMLPEENPADWYGLSYYFKHTPVTRTDQIDLLTYDHAKQERPYSCCSCGRGPPLHAGAVGGETKSAVRGLQFLALQP